MSVSIVALGWARWLARHAGIRETSDASSASKGRPGSAVATGEAMSFAHVLLWLAAGYTAAGTAFALAFVTAGVGRLDPSARGAPLGFRLLILPGAGALWPLLAVKWIRAGAHADRRVRQP
jgi:hypothetical protein